MCGSSLAKALRLWLQLLLRGVPLEENIRTGIAKIARGMTFREQSTVERAIVIVSRLFWRKFMDGLESLGVNDSTAETTRSCQRRGFGQAAGTHRLGHGTSRVALISRWKSNMRHGLVRSDAHHLTFGGIRLRIRWGGGESVWRCKWCKRLKETND